MGDDRLQDLRQTIEGLVPGEDYVTVHFTEKAVHRHYGRSNISSTCGRYISGVDVVIIEHLGASYQYRIPLTDITSIFPIGGKNSSGGVEKTLENAA
tara:strand:+ start:5955 stop:6245 length:291 start_codon:yes stop_codon:yes gene_type:complete